MIKFCPYCKQLLKLIRHVSMDEEDGLLKCAYCGFFLDEELRELKKSDIEKLLKK